MTTETTLILINIAIVGILACIIVKVYYNDKEKKNKELGNYQKESAISSLKNRFEPVRDKISGNSNNKNESDNMPTEMDIRNSLNNPNSVYIQPERPEDNEKIATRVFQEPIEKKHEDMMNQLHNKPLIDRVEENKKLKDEAAITDSSDNIDENDIITTAVENIIGKKTPEIPPKEEDHDLKELFTIDELIKKEKEKDQVNDETVINVDNLDEASSIKKIDDEAYPDLNHQNNKLYSDSVNLLENTPKDDEFGKSLDNDMFTDDDADVLDLGEIKDTIKNSKIMKNVKKFTEEKLIDLNPSEPTPDDDFIRNVKKYDYNEHEYVDDPLNKESSNVVNNKELVPLNKAQKKPTKKSQKSIEISINNVMETIKVGDNVIFNYNGESYSSDVLNIFGDDIEVKYRRKLVIISASDIKKRI